MKKLAIAFAALALFGSAAQAESNTRVVGDWIVKSEDDAFGKGGIYFMVTGNDSFGFAVRCLQKTPNFGIRLSDDTLTPGQKFTVKLRVDRGDIVIADAYALDEHMIQVENNFDIWKELPGGRQLAVNLENEMGTSQTKIFKISGAASALQTVTRECPIKD
ncbi:hypothetical protein [Bradyrhizobium erythrophlei]|uniref:Invasion protein IalB, involved in pathogenesis n=1 Tax=Bradyrhizobium erythrophlei TaxID=1437360 RepID=A0A1M5MPL2_9BRAD|nr:hypothetical protein [Bradyrhizobium erythrophlei]SHG79165.1 hypothetical protein SAMN05443248_2668 [Bradyrhizobium erythrophlei]